jgi:hypothetical protein
MHTPSEKGAQQRCRIEVSPLFLEVWDGETLCDTPAEWQRRAELRERGFTPRQIREAMLDAPPDEAVVQALEPSLPPPSGNGMTSLTADPPNPPLSQLFDTRVAADPSITLGLEEAFKSLEEARKFMPAVVPWPQKDEGASILIHCDLVSGPKLAYAAKTLDQFFRHVGHCRRQVGNIFSCTSLHQDAIRVSEKGKEWPRRGQDLARALNAIWLDLDVKEGKYASLEEAVDDVQRFIDKYNVPRPNALVASGNGLHVYWIAVESMTVEEWRPYASGLKALAIEFGLKADFGVTTDSARILRVPGTFNYKTDPPRPVRLLMLQGVTDFRNDLVVLHEAGLA